MAAALASGLTETSAETPKEIHVSSTAVVVTASFTKAI